MTGRVPVSPSHPPPIFVRRPQGTESRTIRDMEGAKEPNELWKREIKSLSDKENVKGAYWAVKLSMLTFWSLAPFRVQHGRVNFYFVARPRNETTFPLWLKYVPLKQPSPRSPYVRISQVYRKEKSGVSMSQLSLTYYL